jgi:glucose-6-phosphate isomerase
VGTFDQWGVELGKVLATRIAGELMDTADEVAVEHDPSTTALIRRYRARRVWRRG